MILTRRLRTRALVVGLLAVGVFKAPDARASSPAAAGCGTFCANTCSAGGSACRSGCKPGACRNLLCRGTDGITYYTTTYCSAVY